MMMNDDDEPRRALALLVPPVLDRMDVDEMERYIAALRAEIGRVEAEIGRKRAMRSAADSFFRAP